MEKKLIWLGMIIGSIAGNMVPLLWGGSAVSMAGLLGAFVGGVLGIWGGFKLGQMI